MANLNLSNLAVLWINFDHGFFSNRGSGRWFVAAAYETPNQSPRYVAQCQTRIEAEAALTRIAGRAGLEVLITEPRFGFQCPMAVRPCPPESEPNSVEPIILEGYVIEAEAKRVVS